MTARIRSLPSPSRAEARDSEALAEMLIRAARFAPTEVVGEGMRDVARALLAAARDSRREPRSHIGAR